MSSYTDRPGDDHVGGVAALAFDVIGVLVGHVGLRGADVRVRGGRRGADLVPGADAEGVVGPGAELDGPRGVDGGHVVAGHVPRVRREGRVILDGEAQDGGAIVTHRVPTEGGHFLVTFDAVQCRRVRFICKRS